MQTDRYGYELTTASAAAAASWSDGADRFLAADGGSLEAFERAIAEDAGFALARAGRARVLQLRGRAAEARAEATRSRRLAASATERERSHVDALATMIEGDGAGALARIRAHVARHPRDAFALQPATNVFGLIGFSGRAGREQEVFDLLASLARDYEDDWWYLGTLGFWHTELGRIERGLELNRRSLEANPRNGNAAHGLAHAWYELGDDAAGIGFLERFLASCPRDAGMHCHVSWHLALFDLRSGRPDRMWAIYADAIAPGASALAPPLNTATDAASMLWRAALHGERVEAERWREVRAFSLQRFPSASIAFLDVHRAIACAMAGDPATLESVVSAMRDADAQGKLPSGAVSPDAIEGLAAFARGDDAAAVRWLAPRLDELVRIGGSHAQRDLFTHTLMAAYLREDRLDEARALAERTPWRADSEGRSLIERASGRRLGAGDPEPTLSC
jgi:tetratricopeptide (TPR) repeat protein